MAGEDQNLRLFSDVYTHAHIHTQKIKRTTKETTGFILGEGRGERDGETKNSKDILVQAMSKPWRDCFCLSIIWGPVTLTIP